MPQIRSACVYCGSSNHVSDKFKDAATRLGQIFVQNDIELVYGGSRVGLMGKVADAVMDHGGRVFGVLPEHLQTYEKGHEGITQLTITKDMHERKKLMFEMAEAFVVMPGGFGTMDEMFEIITWRQLRLHNFPVVIVNMDGYWDPLIKLMDHMIANKFASDATRSLYTVVNSVEEVVPMILSLPSSDILPHPERI